MSPILEGTAVPPSSALSKLLQDTKLKAADTTSSTGTGDEADTRASPAAPNDISSVREQLHDLAIQIKHNLQHQHRWTDLTIHWQTTTTTTDQSTATSDIRASNTADSTRKRTRHDLVRPLISGLPPTRLYMHPNEQVALLTRSKSDKTPLSATTFSEPAEPAAAAAAAAATDATSTPTSEASGLKAIMANVKAEREWVLPSHLNAKWTLRRFGEVFDRIDLVPPPPPPPPPPSLPSLENEKKVHVNSVDESIGGDDESSGQRGGDQGEERHDATKERSRQEVFNPWRTQKRVLLATVDTDSTVAYYLVHDGVVKPRQN